MARIPNPETKARWITLYAEYRNSGLSVNRFAAAKNVTPAAMYSWFKRLRLPTDPAPKPQANPYPSVRVSCTECGCNVRMAPKWIAKVGTPTCGCGGEMEVMQCTGSR